MNTTVTQHYGTVKEVTLVFDQLQQSFNCCGTKGPASWTALKGFHGEKVLPASGVPESCYNVDNTSQMSYTDGCSKKIVSAYQEFYKIFIGSCYYFIWFLLLSWMIPIWFLLLSWYIPVLGEDKKTGEEQTQTAEVASQCQKLKPEKSISYKTLLSRFSIKRPIQPIVKSKSVI